MVEQSVAKGGKSLGNLHVRVERVTSGSVEPLWLEPKWLRKKTRRWKKLESWSRTGEEVPWINWPLWPLVDRSCQDCA